MNDIERIRTNLVIRYLIVELTFLANASKLCQAQAYTPIFKTVEIKPVIAPLGRMVEGDFFGQPCLAAISKSEKAVYFLSPDAQENLELSNVVTLPDTPIAISQAKAIVIDTTGHLTRQLSQLTVLMKPNHVMLVSFDSGGHPILSEETTTDPFSTDIEGADLEVNGNVDIITFGKFSLGVSISENTGGKFHAAHPGAGSLGGTPFSDLAFADFNGDLVPDIAALDWVDHRLMIFYGRGDGTFAQPVILPLRAEPSTLSVADLSGNGYPDIVVGYSRISVMDIYSGDGFGRFFLRQTVETAGPVSEFAIADFTGDGTMDIAALSRTTGEITLSYYDPMSKSFRYGGAFGIGQGFDEVEPFYFPNHVRADLIASSPTEAYLKVFRTVAGPFASGDALIPISSEARLFSVACHDTSNCMVVADKRGGISWDRFAGRSPLSTRFAIHIKSKGVPASMKIVSADRSELLVSYGNADLLSVYEIGKSGKQIKEMNAVTAFAPFAVNGGFRQDSLILAAAYKLNTDSTVEIANFGKLRDRDEFIERDYSVAERNDYLSSALTITPVVSFDRVWKAGKDSLVFAYTDLSKRRTVNISLRGSDAALLSDSWAGFPWLALECDDTLSVSRLSLVDSSMLVLMPVNSLPLDDSDFRSVSIASDDSTSYLAFYNHAVNAVFLYNISGNQPRFVRSWSLRSEPNDISISPSARVIYFLNADESYVSIQYF